MSEAEERARVVTVARSWILTPYHHHGRLKGVGVDCATLLLEVFAEAGIVPALATPAYSPQHFLHRSVEKYLAEITKYAHETSEPKPADIVVYKMGRTFSHGGIVVDPGWPAIVHADGAARMVIEDIGDGGRFADRERKFFSRW